MMQYTPQDLFVGALDNVPNCTDDSAAQEIFPKFMLMVLFHGRQHFVIDGTSFCVDAGDHAAETPLVFMLNVAKQSMLHFINDSDVPLRKVMISAPHPWLERLMQTQDGAPAKALRSFFGEHLASFSFTPGQNILQQAEKIMHPPQMLEGELGSLYLNAAAFDIMWQSCLALVADRGEGPQAPGLQSLRNCERIRDFIIANLDQELTIDRIASEAGASTSTVQRHFKEHFGLTIFDFIRQKRLDAARKALAAEGIPVAKAAHMAGYNSISSFTTAFRKAYGVTPKQARA